MIPRRIRVVVADDSLTVRRRLCDVLASSPDFEVVGEAEDGKRAIELCVALRPDLVTLDMMMPVMTGLATTEYIMAHCPTPILIVSASVNRGELFRTYDALSAGAVDVLDKPRGDELDGDWERRFLDAAKMVSRIRVITHPRARLRGLTIGARPPRPLGSASRPDLIAIGASTGGPAAIVDVLRALPAGLPIPLLVVLHINEPFGTAFAEWLDAQTSYRTSFAKDGERLAPGRVMLAPPERHLVVERDRVRLTQDPPRHSCRPAVDALFESLAQHRGPTTAAALLTGMGHDGAAGLLQIRNAGGHTIAQDEASCVVFGMPREAILLGAAGHVVPLREIGPLLASLVGEEAR